MIYNYDNVPGSYFDYETGFSKVITRPCVVVKVDAGKSRYRLPYISNLQKSIKYGIHEWVPRK